MVIDCSYFYRRSEMKVLIKRKYSEETKVVNLSSHVMDCVEDDATGEIEQIRSNLIDLTKLVSNLLCLLYNGKVINNISVLNGLLDLNYNTEWEIVDIANKEEELI